MAFEITTGSATHLYIPDSFVFHSPNTDYVDDDGYYISSKFSKVPLYWLTGSQEGYTLSSGEVGIFYELFVEEIEDNAIYFYYSISDSDLEFEYDDYYNQMYYSYDSDEELALQERFGSTGDTESFIEDFVDTISTAVATAAVNAEYTFKKVKYDDLDYDNLSSFEEDEATQSVSVTTSYVSEIY